VAVALSFVVSGVLSDLVGAQAWLVTVIAVGAGWRYVPGFWRTVLAGAAGGAIAGVTILGPGFRLAMRIVAVLDPVRVPEFTIEGTLFILIMVGAFLGAILAIGAALIRRGLDLSRTVMTGWMSAVIMGLLLLDTGTRDEFMDLGAGAWLNIPMFGSVVFLYALVANRLIERFSVRKPGPATLEPVEVQA